MKPSFNFLQVSQKLSGPAHALPTPNNTFYPSSSSSSPLLLSSASYLFFNATFASFNFAYMRPVIFCLYSHVSVSRRQSTRGAERGREKHFRSEDLSLPSVPCRLTSPLKSSDGRLCAPLKARDAPPSGEERTLNMAEREPSEPVRISTNHRTADGSR